MTDQQCEQNHQIPRSTPSIIVLGFGLSIEQPACDPTTQRFYTSIPVHRQQPTGLQCQFEGAGPVTCDGGLLVTDPTAPTAVQGAFNYTSLTGVVLLHPANRNAATGGCGPNGATVGPNENLLLGCTPGNNPSDTTTLVIKTRPTSLPISQISPAPTRSGGTKAMTATIWAPVSRTQDACLYPGHRPPRAFRAAEGLRGARRRR